MDPKKFQVRQGDLLIESDEAIANLTLEQISKTPALDEGPVITLLEGEATGHAHQVKARKAGEKASLFEMGGRRYIRVPAGGADLIHPEHGTIPFDNPGVYEVVRQSIFTGSARSGGRADVLD